MGACHQKWREGIKGYTNEFTTCTFKGCGEQIKTGEYALHIDHHLDSLPSGSCKLSFPCSKEYCTLTFSRDKLRIIHERKHQTNLILDPQELIYTCNVCFKVFLMVANMVVHLKSCKQSQCGLCFKQFRRKELRDRHVRYFHNKEKKKRPFTSLNSCDQEGPSKKRTGYLCEKCQAKFTEKDKYISHLKVKHGEFSRDFKCQYCKSTFGGKQALSYHIARMHSKKDIGAPTLRRIRKRRCDMCDTQVMHDVLFKHSITCHQRYLNGLVGQESDTTTCSFNDCGENVNNDQYALHLHGHLASDSLVATQLYPCTKECLLKYVSQERLSMHLKVHETKKDHGCLDEPSNSGTEDKTKKKLKCHECGTCNAKFARKSEYVNHLKNEHGIEKQEYVCSHCGISYLVERSLKCHVANVHSPIDADAPTLRRVRKCSCDLCGKTFAQQSLFGHTVTCHVKIIKGLLAQERKIITCSFNNCGKDIRKEKYALHMHHHIDDDFCGSMKRKFRCSKKNCTLEFVTQQKLDLHLIVHETAENHECMEHSKSSCSQDGQTSKRHPLKKGKVVKKYTKVVCDICKNDIVYHYFYNHVGDCHQKWREDVPNFNLPTTTCTFQECGLEMSTGKYMLHVHHHLNALTKRKIVNPLSCSEINCALQFSTEEKLKIHILAHKTNKCTNPDECIYTCAFCEQKFVKPANTKRHRKSCTPSECEICGRKFSNKSKKDYHMQKVHNKGSINAHTKATENPSFYDCQDCNHVVVRIRSLQNHYAKKHLKKVTHESIRKKITHVVEEYLPTSPYLVCPLCDKLQDTHLKLYHHLMKMDFVIKYGFTCPHCFDYVTKSSKDALQHMVACDDSTANRYNCDICLEMISGEKVLNHCLMHLKPKNICGNKGISMCENCKQVYSLRRDIRMQHEICTKAILTFKKYLCSDCDRWSRDRTMMIDHILSDHRRTTFMPLIDDPKDQRIDDQACWRNHEMLNFEGTAKHVPEYECPFCTAPIYGKYVAKRHIHHCTRKFSHVLIPSNDNKQVAVPELYTKTVSSKADRRPTLTLVTP